MLKVDENGIVCKCGAHPRLAALIAYAHEGAHDSEPSEAYVNLGNVEGKS